MTKTRTQLKGYFRTGDKPTQENFAALVDGMLNQEEDNIFKAPDGQLSIRAVANKERMLNFYRNDSGLENPDWALSLQDPQTSRAGFSINDAGSQSRLFIDSANGNVGIATQAPKQALHVSGDYYGKGHIWLHAYEGDGNSGVAYVQARDSTNTSKIALQLRTQNGGPLEALRIEPNGNVGIGSTSPIFRLDVHGDSSSNDGITIENMGTGNPQLCFKKNGSDFVAITAITTASDQADPGKLHLWIKGHGDVLNLIGGNVGIGTNAPNSKLHVNGSLRTSSAAIGQHFRVASNGYVGIGTNNPKAPLHVTIRTTNKVDGKKTYRDPNQSGWNEYYAIATHEWVGAYGYANWSDARVKKNPRKLDAQEALRVINDLNLVDYEYIPTYKVGHKDGRGVYAQEIQNLLPDAVSTFPEMELEDGTVLKDFLSVDYNRIFTTGLAAIQELSRQHETLQRTVAKLNERLETTQV